MTDQADEALKEKQRRALDVYQPSGAMIQHNHLNRQQEVVGVTRDDLEDVLGFDAIAAVFGALGMFLLSGAGWLIVENSLDSDGFAFDSLMAFCVPAAFFGIVALCCGGFFFIKKRGRIKRIFDQTKSIASKSSSADN